MTDYSKIVFSFIFVYLAFCTYKDLTVQTISEKHIPITKVGMNTHIRPTLRFLYCYSCGYRKAFEDYSKVILDKYPDLTITGSNFDPPGLNMQLARILGLAKMIAIVCVLFGINIFTYFGMEQPNWWTWCTTNRIYACLLIFFVSNAIETRCTSTGAFEIYFNDIPIWSKLETGRIPHPHEFFQIIENHMHMGETIDLESGFPK